MFYFFEYLYLYVLLVSPFLHTSHLRLEAGRDHRENHKAATFAIKYIKLPIAAIANKNIKIIVKLEV